MIYAENWSSWLTDIIIICHFILENLTFKYLTKVLNIGPPNIIWCIAPLNNKISNVTLNLN